MTTDQKNDALDKIDFTPPGVPAEIIERLHRIASGEHAETFAVDTATARALLDILIPTPDGFYVAGGLGDSAIPHETVEEALDELSEGGLDVKQEWIELWPFVELPAIYVRRVGPGVHEVRTSDPNVYPEGSVEDEDRDGDA